MAPINHGAGVGKDLMPCTAYIMSCRELSVLEECGW